ncbi:Trimeric intracellular cation channel type A [Orchesella cincta]|uniref:Trimeric intracellular cation channel type A n=1 Tax=Orchesella cincta TaxID=48709 RepID=A0A1D2M6S4_ORCCI|nr:Trimeric intracellular cation channel type A [Orchesella cincta]
MDPEMFLDVANQVTKLKMFPYFDIAHAAVCCLHAGSASRRHPLATWICSLVEIYAGGILASLFLGEPVLGPLKSNEHLVLYTLVWYLVFYCPFDAVYKICKFLPVKLASASIGRKSIGSRRSMMESHTHSKSSPTDTSSRSLLELSKETARVLCKIFERLLRGIWTPGAIEILQPSFPTKACIAASVIFVLDKKTDFISARTVCCISESCVFFRVLQDLFNPARNPRPVCPVREHILCVVHGCGLADAITRAFGSKPRPKEGR